MEVEAETCHKVLGAGIPKAQEVALVVGVALLTRAGLPESRRQRSNVLNSPCHSIDARAQNGTSKTSVANSLFGLRRRRSPLHQPQWRRLLLLRLLFSSCVCRPFLWAQCVREEKVILLCTIAVECQQNQSSATQTISDEHNEEYRCCKSAIATSMVQQWYMGNYPRTRGIVEAPRISAQWYKGWLL